MQRAELMVLQTKSFICQLVKIVPEEVLPCNSPSLSRAEKGSETLQPIDLLASAGTEIKSLIEMPTVQIWSGTPMLIPCA